MPAVSSEVVFKFAVFSSGNYVRKNMLSIWSIGSKYEKSLPSSKMAKLKEEMGSLEAVSVGTDSKKEKWRQIGKDG